jgi:hemerythrin-like domain-containing protein
MSTPGRRAILLAGGGLAVGAATTGTAWAATGSPAPARDGLPPDDDLMREHGVLKRVLLCYRAMTSQVQAGHPLTAAHVQDAALIIHDFIEGFHEGLEEGYVFPRLRQAGPINSTVNSAVTSTVSTLLVQHARGRVITQYLLAQAAPVKTGPGGTLSADTSARVSGAMQAFVRMYEPHEAREDTVVFPAFPGHRPGPGARRPEAALRRPGAAAVRPRRVHRHGRPHRRHRAGPGQLRPQPVHPVGHSLPPGLTIPAAPDPTPRLPA